MVDVAVSCASGKIRVRKKVVEQIVAMVFRKERAAGGKISCVFVDDKTIRKINSRYLGHSSATDVITFPIEPPPSLEAEIYINIEQARRQARDFNVTVANELTRLVVHGVLHALGYDDRRTKDRKKMFDKQERYVRMTTDGARVI